MNRIVVLGGRGFFGASAVDRLRHEGLRPLVASRRAGGDLTADAEDVATLRAALRTSDVIVDAAGPFQQRSTILAETCLEVGCSLIDLSDSVDYVMKIQALASGKRATRGCLLPACSSVSAISAALVRLSGVQQPVRVSAFLAPATRNTSTPATAASLLSTLERPVRMLRGGTIIERRAFSEQRTFDLPAPVGTIRSRLAESPDALLLPAVWPDLRDVDFWVDTRRRALNATFAAAARFRSIRTAVGALQPLGRLMTKRFGARSGGFGIEVEAADGTPTICGFVHASHSYVVAVAPAILAARDLASGVVAHAGLVPVDRYVDPPELLAWLRRAGVQSFGLPHP